MPGFHTGFSAWEGKHQPSTYGIGGIPPPEKKLRLGLTIDFSINNIILKFLGGGGGGGKSQFPTPLYETLHAQTKKIIMIYFNRKLIQAVFIDTISYKCDNTSEMQSIVG